MKAEGFSARFFRLKRSAGRLAGRLATSMWRRYGLLFPLSIQYKLAEFAGTVASYYLPRARTVAYQQLRRAFPEKSDAECRRIVRLCMSNLMKSLVEMLNLPSWSKAELARKLEIKGIEHFHEALAKGQGAILLTGHFGNWEMLGARLVDMGLPLQVVAKKLHDPVMNRFAQIMRLRNGLQVIPSSSPLRAFRALKQNNIVAMLIDQHAGRNGVFVPFFWRETSTFKGPAVLALKTKAAVIPVFVERNPDNTLIARVYPPLEIVRTGDFDADVLENTRRFTQIIEAQVRRKPEEWLWVHRRWKTPPPRSLDQGKPDLART